VIPVRRFEGDFHLMMATQRGLVKKTPLADYSRPRQGGIIGINLEDGDTLISVALTKPGDEVVLSSKNGMAIRFAETDARSMGRNTKGVKGIKLKAGDDLVGMVVADPDGYLLTVCENGFGKRTPFGPNTVSDEPEGEDAAEPAEEALEPEGAEPAEGEEEETRDRSQMRYRRQRRGGGGVHDIRTGDRNGPVVGVASVREGDDVMLITAQGMVTRMTVSEIRVVGRNTKGVRVMNLGDGDTVASLAKIAREEVGDVPEDAAPQP
jgi:DNA gyrase subunit A